MSLKTFAKKHRTPSVFIGVGLLLSIFVFSGLFIYLNNRVTHAADTANFDPGNIISDSVFFNPQTMSVSDIQNFLNNKVQTCDTNGTQIYSGSTTRAQYSASKGYSAPFTCLKDYSTTTNQEPADTYCNGYAASTQTSAQIIYNVAQSCGINPQVLLVLLQKEQGLVTDTWPWTAQYQKATGYACPDTSGCDTSYYGLFNQIYFAARQYKIYQANPQNYSYRAYRNNAVLWNPNSACGNSTVYIQNQATAGLYNYTPYQPNAAALAAGYGTGDSCSSYGNRNFWLYFTDWFGSTQGVVAQPGAVWRLYQPTTGDHLLTASAVTATLYITKGWSNDGVVMHAAISGGSPVYQLWNGSSHFYTSNENTLTAYLAAGWVNNGAVFNAPSTGSPIYQLYNGSLHFYTDNAAEVTAYVKSGWKNDGIAFYEPTIQIDPVYRLYSPINGDHLMTDNAVVMNTYFAAGWVNDGVVMQGSGQTGTPVYQLWNGSSHFYTTSESIKSTYMSASWKDDGIAFYTTTGGTPVYQLWNGSSHFYTDDSNEVSAYISAGWVNNGAVFTTSNQIGVRRIINTTTNAHMLVTSTTQFWQMLTNGWTDDGALLNASTSYGTPVYELRNSATGSYLYTTSSTDRTSYINAGWLNDGLVFYTPSQGTPFYRLYNPMSSLHIIVSQQELQNYVNAGWLNDGLVFYGF